MFRPRSNVGPRRAARILAALALVVSCSERSTTGPSLGSSGTDAPTLLAGKPPVFVVPPELLNIPTYDGSGQVVHPDVVQFDTPWHGARFWMTMTPYPSSDQTLENPSILTSDDGITVRVPGGLANPVVKAPHRSADYNSDPELIYEPQTGRLVLFYRLVDKHANTVRVATSRDGLKWTEVRSPFWEHRHQVVSPTVAPRPDAAARMWYVNAGPAGCDAKATRVVMRTSSDSSGRVVGGAWVHPVSTNLHIPGYEIWHIKARWIAAKSEYLMVISAFPDGGNGCKTDDLFLARSTDGTHWTVYKDPIMRHGDLEWTGGSVYRTTFLYDDTSDELSLWISARGSDGAWRMGYARMRYASLVDALANGQQISPRPTRQFPAPTLSSAEQP